MTAITPVGAEQAWQTLSAARHGRALACQGDAEAWFATDLAARRLGLVARRLGLAARRLGFIAGRRNRRQPPLAW
jgi:hypothetical protein